MARTPRSFHANTAYHIMNRAAARAQIFLKPADYAAFEKTLADAHARYGIPILAYVVMPNHFHLVLQPKAEWVQEAVRAMNLEHTVRPTGRPPKPRKAEGGVRDGKDI